MTFHIPTLIEVGAILIIAFIAGFAWSAGSWLFSRIISRTAS